ncbi:hypothetical protein MKW98_029818 [Papaver atlanticum]|uniref:RING-type E3 ubiquitin transferase n=1 Tax=Papaver atlanticum TaxID=357466 RepID=A0AAD4XZ13_9MAGN|nr:hypothetical protein MKW98_029818 [Papaver atlanticum]
MHRRCCTLTSHDLNPRDHRRQREPHANQSNRRRWIGEISAIDDDNNYNSSISQENLDLAMDRQIEDGKLHDIDNDETEEESLDSTEGRNSNSHDLQNQERNDYRAVISPLNNHAQSLIDNIRRIRHYDEYNAGNLYLRMLPSLNAGPPSIDDTDGIDDMSYEGLMELQERIGKVGGLSKETISSHLKTRVGATCVESAEEETKICTICQDVYENKDKIGTLDCQHEYHEDCITQWLVQKNVCPICKSQGLKTTEEASQK